MTDRLRIFLHAFFAMSVGCRATDFFLVLLFNSNFFYNPITLYILELV